MQCLHCKKDTTNPKFCSKSCSASFSNSANPKRKKRKLSKQCSKEGCCNVVWKHRSRLCEKHWKERSREGFENLTLKDVENAYPNLHQSSRFVKVRSFARSWLKELTQLPCYKCGYDKHVELCHIKAISDFNETTTLGEINCLENVVQLCPNCHWEFDKGLWRLRRDSNPH